MYRVIPSDVSIRNLPYTYRLKKQELHLHELLLSVAEDVQGSLRPLGDGLFFIYSTYGEIEHYVKVGKLQKLMHLSKTQTGLEIRMGVGYGASVLEAENHVLQAFEHARQADFPQLVVMNEDNELIILDTDDSAMTYEANNFGSDWHELFEGATITPTMVVKILSFSQHYNKVTFTSQDVAAWMKSTERNGRRIVTELERLGLIHVIKEQQSGNRGRPRKVYEFKNIQQ
ncbi:hypothetical protein [Psychrobacillus sp. L4]|uniref:hypothetical protein n=1 Tax=Psychrobacillus sp. L4 TaxID=3236892 RepID=UPI0036F40FA0